MHDWRVVGYVGAEDRYECLRCGSVSKAPPEQDSKICIMSDGRPHVVYAWDEFSVVGCDAVVALMVHSQ